MTREQLDRANELRRQINRLTELLDALKKVKIDDSPCRMTGFTILNDNYKFFHIVENYELIFLKDSIESHINILEREFSRV